MVQSEPMVDVVKKLRDKDSISLFGVKSNKIVEAMVP